MSFWGCCVKLTKIFTNLMLVQNILQSDTHSKRGQKQMDKSNKIKIDLDQKSEKSNDSENQINYFLNKAAIKVLQKWFLKNIEHPYITKKDKA